MSLERVHTIAVTGSTGFLGRAVVARLARSGHRVRAIARSAAPVAGAGEFLVTQDLGAEAERLLAGCTAVVNCAARAHVIKREHPAVAAAAFMAANRDLAIRLAEVARGQGIGRFVQISSVAAVGHDGGWELRGDASDPNPNGAYGRAKLEADIAISAMRGDRFQPLSLRPPAIYGPGAPAWFGLLHRLARTGVPLPIGGIENRRSYAFVHNVADAIACAVESESIGTFIVTDSPPVSTADMYRRLSLLYGHRRRVWNVPAGLVTGAAQLVLGNRVTSLVGNAGFDGAAFAAAHDWWPPYTMDEGLRITVAGQHAQA